MSQNSESSIAQHFLEYAIKRFQKLKTKAEKAFNQIKNDDDLFLLLDDKSNSIAILIRHLAGNMRSRWTDFLTTDGEKPDRNRPSEFDRTTKVTKDELIKVWEAGWKCVFDSVSALTPSDLMKDVYIRKKSYSVLEAIGWQLSHYSAHIGQIIFLAKHIEAESWEWSDVY
ncbi:MAG: DUF1572 family protein [Candidatus Heimdallarchaeota archaeon]|nr:MAG: DUF1572 family protein [Candidatus Heimdallarchaeota archaeon]